eukprot:1510847-Amphidinium_carterae.1
MTCLSLFCCVHKVHAALLLRALDHSHYNFNCRNSLDGVLGTCGTSCREGLFSAYHHSMSAPVSNQMSSTTNTSPRLRGQTTYGPTESYYLHQFLVSELLQDVKWQLDQNIKNGVTSRIR